MELKNSCAIVTGASSGIGLSTTKLLLQAGVVVAGWSRTEPDIQNAGFRHFKVDIADSNAVDKAYRETLLFFGKPVDILVNNAGLGYFKLFESLSHQEWHRMFDVNVHGLFNTTRLVIPAMKKNRKGHIINIASTAGKDGIPEATGYCATKFAVRGFSLALYKEVKKYGIKISCVFPGSVNTEFFTNYPGIHANESMLASGDIAKVIVQVLETPDGMNTSEIEIRPMNPDYRA